MPKPPQRNALAAFMPTTPGEALPGAVELPLDMIAVNPAQPRQVFDETKLAELATSIREHGVLQPILVRPVGEGYQIIAGERRKRAAQAVGLAVIPAIIRDDLTNEQAALFSALENLQRDDLDIEDEARFFVFLLEETGLSQRDLAKQLGIKHNYIAERVRMLGYPELMAAYRAGTLTWRAALDEISARNAPLLPTPQDPQLSAPQTIAPTIVERAELDARPDTANRTPSPHMGAASDSVLQRTPWRERPLTSFMTWVARVDVTTVPDQELTTTLDQLAEARTWLTRLELQLQERKNRESE